MPGDNSYFGTRAEVDAIKNRRNAEIRAWGKKVLEEADRAKFGGNFKEDWDEVPQVTDDEPLNNDNDASLDEPAPAQEPAQEVGGETPEGDSHAAEEPAVVKPAAKAKAATSKGSTADK